MKATASYVSEDYMSLPVKRSYGREIFKTFEDGIKKEWVITNGLGGYAGSSVIGANTRKHHGLFIAATYAPTDRYVILNRIDEKVTLKNTKETVSFSSVQRKKKKYEKGYLYQTGFSYDAVPEFTYIVDGTYIKKSLAYEWEKNTVAINYEVFSPDKSCTLTLTPSFNYRSHNDGSKRLDLRFKIKKSEEELSLIPKKAKNISIKLYKSEGEFIERQERYDTNIELQTEIDTGMSSADTGFMPYDIAIDINQGVRKNISIIVSIEEKYEKNAVVTIANARDRASMLIERAGFEDPFLKSLTVAADNFIVKRASTGGKTILAGLPWFADWGRDTMISLTGLTLLTKRFEDAKSILKTFASYEKNGLLPNMFPDNGVEPLYNTVDASLWYFYCIHMYLQYDNSKRAAEFVKNDIYPCLKNIIKAYREGTDFSIKMCDDYLISAGSDTDQVTWMDVRIKDYVVTPRHGKPVEINALWYNALKVIEKLAMEYEDEVYADEMAELSQKVKESFTARFYNSKAGCLYDVVDEVQRDNITVKNNESIRPNQIWAVSLPFTMLDRETEVKVVNTVISKLYADYGLRTLPKDDPNYHGIYFGKLKDRDMAYHQGTSWAFPLGGLVSAYLKVNDYSASAKEYAINLLEPLKHHLDDGCIGGIAEIFDGDAPFVSRGCYSQAWSVGEILRAYAEVIC